MKRKNNRKGFTIVELVITIAVIGVLTAILVPTFVGLTKKANEASDNSLVTNLNKALAIHEVQPGDTKNVTPQDAIDDLKDEGYLADVLVTKSEKTLVWCDKDNRFHLATSDGVEELPEGATSVDCWAICHTMPTDQTYSIYAGSNWNVEDVVNLTVGFDAGESTNVKSVSYVRPSTATPQTVVLRTNSSETSVHVKAPTDTVRHYGIAGVVDLEAVASTSYHENGLASLAKIKNGRLVVTETAEIAGVHLVATEGNYDGIKIGVVGNAQLPSFTRDVVDLAENETKLVLEVQALATASTLPTETDKQYVWVKGLAGGTVEAKVSSSSETATAEVAQEFPAAAAVKTEAEEPTTAEELEEYEEAAARYAGGIGTEEKPYLLATKQHYTSMDEDYAEHVTAGKYYKLAADIDLGKIYPIGTMSLVGHNGTASQGYTITYSSCFQGNIDGANHSITYSMAADSGLGTGANTLGLFGAIENCTIKNLVINADVVSARASVWVGGLAGFAWHCDLENVTMNGTIEAAHDVGGFFGYYSNGGIGTATSAENSFVNCTNNASVVCNSQRSGGNNYAIAGGFIGQLTPEDASDLLLTFRNCKSNGSITIGTTPAGNGPAASYFAGFVSDNAAKTNNIRFSFENCEVGSNATFTSSVGDHKVVSTKTVYCGPSAEAIAICPSIKYVGVSSEQWSAKAAQVHVFVDGVEQDMSAHIVA